MPVNTNFDPSTLAAIAFTRLGARVDRPTQSTALLFTTAKVPLFTVAGGRILLTGFVGEVTTVVSNDASLVKLTGTPTVGSSVDLCANSGSIAQKAAGTVLTITGTLATGMTLGEAGGVLWMATPQAIDIGTIDITGSIQGVTGSIKFSMWYLPLEDGAYVTSTL